MRQYAQIWGQLKQHMEAKLLAPSSRHQTIVNMVRKEKYLDKVWKLQCSENRVRYKLYHESNVGNGLLEFKLVDVTVRQIRLEDL